MSLLINEKIEMKNKLIEEYFYNAKYVQQTLKRDNLFAIKIQRQFKRFLNQKKFKLIKYSCIIISKFFKGFLSRNNYNLLILEKEEEKNLEYFKYMAIIIQKNYRGYYSRKYVHSFYGRRRVLKEIENKNKVVLNEMNKYKEEIEQFYKTKIEEQNNTNFQNAAKKLHHLISTKKIPGVYNPPYGNKHRMNGIVAEDFIKQTFKKHLNETRYNTIINKN